MRASNHARGFVLPITVMLLALVSFGVALMAQRSDQLRALVAAARQEQQAAQALQDALAQLVYASSVLHRRGGRMGEIEIDGRFYRLPNGTLVRVQDGAGLFNLRRAPQPELLRLLQAVGIDERQADRLTDTLLDYVDADSLERLNGAEARDYAAAGRAPPRNARLLTPSELLRVADWHLLEPMQRRRVLEQVYIGPTRVLNRHTATSAVIAATSGADPAFAADLVAQREAGQPLRIESLPDIATGSFLTAGRYSTMPSATLVVTFCHPAVAWCEHLSISTISTDPRSPWHIAHQLRLPRSEPLPDAAAVALLPDQPPDRPPPPLFSPFASRP
jgi:type II secretory pathway component PulK